MYIITPYHYYQDTFNYHKKFYLEIWYFLFETLIIYYNFSSNY